MLDRRIKLRHLQCFLAVARHESVMAAADALAISQPAVSKTIRELEEILDTQLFDRTRRELALTRMGDLFLRYAGASIAALTQGVESVGRAQSGELPTVRIGALPTVAARIMPEAVRIFRARGPGPTLSLATGSTGVLLNQLRVGELDLVVGRLAEPGQMSGLSFTHLYSERVGFVVRPGHPLLAKTGFALADIAGYDVLYPIEGAVIRPSVNEVLLAHGIGSLAGRIDTVSNAFGRAYTRATDAVWIISRGVVAQDLEEGVLVELPVETGDTRGPVGFTTRADTPAPPQLSRLMHAIEEVAAAKGDLL
jgi:LysR family pca operon transcriptional activator